MGPDSSWNPEESVVARYTSCIGEGLHTSQIAEPIDVVLSMRDVLEVILGKSMRAACRRWHTLVLMYFRYIEFLIWPNRLAWPITCKTWTTKFIGNRSVVVMAQTDEFGYSRRASHLRLGNIMPSQPTAPWIPGFGQCQLFFILLIQRSRHIMDDGT
jgi:hypothetical protein